MLEAVVPEEGMAILRDGGKLFLLRPPYNRALDVISLPEDGLEDAILRYDFHAAQMEFVDHAAVIAHLRARIRELHPALDQAPSEEVLQDRLDRISAVMPPALLSLVLLSPALLSPALLSPALLSLVLDQVDLSLNVQGGTALAEDRYALLQAILQNRQVPTDLQERARLLLARAGGMHVAVAVGEPVGA
jgi:hypothetical protein